MNNKIVAVIPARSGSKGVKNKNIHPLNSKPLISFSIQAANFTQSIERVFVSTDSQQYAEIALKYGAEVPFLRPKEISQDMSTDYEFMNHFLNWYYKTNNSVPAYIIHLRPTTPLRDPAIIEKAIQTMINCENATALRSIHEMSESAYKTFELTDSLLKCIGTGSYELDHANNARQSFPTTYFANGYVDILKSEIIVNDNLIHGNKVIGYITPCTTEVDTYDDIDYLEFLIQTKSKKIVDKLFGESNVV